METRYKGEPKRLYDFMNQFDVHCPKCSEKAIVEVPVFLDFKNAKLTCSSCHFMEHNANRKRFILTGKAKCTNCLEWMNLKTEGMINIPKYIKIKCNSCDFINNVSENWTETIKKYKEIGILDPVFGLPLWYTDSVKGKDLWAYNLNHLQEIKSYVSAKLRERSTQRFKMTMVEKLPDFIKEAKNRDEVLKSIARMEYKSV